MTDDDNFIGKWSKAIREMPMLAALPAAPTVGAGVDDAMIAAASKAYSDYFNDETRLVVCGTCNGDGAIPVGVDADRDYCPTCGGPPGMVFDGDEDGAFRAALEAGCAALLVEVAAGRERERKLQCALDRWLPCIAGEQTPEGEQCAKDANLLLGLCDPEGPDYGEAMRMRAELAEANLAGMGADARRLTALHDMRLSVVPLEGAGWDVVAYSEVGEETPLCNAGDLRDAIDKAIGVTGYATAILSDAALSRAQGTE